MHRRCLAAVLTSAQFVLAQSPDGQSLDVVEDPGLVITAESSLVVVPLHVYRKKTSIDGLTAESFELLENGEPREIAFVEGPPGEDGGPGRSVPVEIILLLDVSHSVMRRGLLDIHTIRKGILDHVNDHVSISLYGFAGKLTRFASPTNDETRLERALERAYEAEHGGTRIYESVVQTVRDASAQDGSATRMMVVISDGFSTSPFESAWAVRAANHFGIPLYPVVLGHKEIVERVKRSNARNARRSAAAPGRRQAAGNARRRQAAGGASARQSRAYEQELRQKEFADLGKLTGGRSYDLKNQSPAALRSILTSLATLAQTEYIVGYYPSRAGEEATRREVTVRLKDKSIGRLYGGRRVIVH